MTDNHTDQDKSLAHELESLRQRLAHVSEQVGETLGEAAHSSRRKARELLGYEPLSAEQREHLIRSLAELKSQRRNDNQMITHWLEAEREVDLLLQLLHIESLPPQEED